MKFLLIPVFTFVFGVFMFMAGTKIDHHSCMAPCVVTFSQPMVEDAFWFDYGGTGTLRVYKTISGTRTEVQP